MHITQNILFYYCRNFDLSEVLLERESIPFEQYVFAMVTSTGYFFPHRPIFVWCKVRISRRRYIYGLCCGFNGLFPCLDFLCKLLITLSQEAAVTTCSSKQVFLKISQNFQQVFSCKYYENFKNYLFDRTPPDIASISQLRIFHVAGGMTNFP